MLRDPRTYRIIGCAMAVHRKLGSGFLEAAYHQALAIEFGLQGVPFQREVPFAIFYEGRRLETEYRADFVCFGEVLVELKAHLGLGLPDTAQVVNYLKASGLEVGLLLNFGLGSLEHRRFVQSRARKTESAQWPAEAGSSRARPE
ncbi:MAG TPA: GxxExxY protein [Candidatus Thermoplasmatota archaeon]|nr:GxxExxY protein [Candidatus Thermoplasmatota archaeon]